MSAMDMPTTYDSKTTTTTTSSSGASPSVNLPYLTSLPGILKIVEIVLSILTFICSVARYWAPLGGGWVDFVAFVGFVCTAVLLILYVLNLIDKVPFPMILVELIYYITITLFFLIAAIVAAVNGDRAHAIAAAAFFAFAATAVFGIDVFLQFRAYRSGTVQRTTTSSQGASTVTTTTVETREVTY